MPKNLNYKIGALKRKFKVKDFEPGTLISKVNEQKGSNIKSNNQVSKTRLAIMGLV